MQQNFAIIPIDSIQVSSSAKGHDATMMFDGVLETFWAPDVQDKSYAQVSFITPHIVRGFDIAFGKGDKRRHTFSVEYLDQDGRTLKRINIYETKGTTTEPIRINIPDLETKALRFNFISHSENGHVGVLVEVSELRIYGVISENEAPGVNMPSLPCPEGHFLDASTGRCIKDEAYTGPVIGTEPEKPASGREQPHKGGDMENPDEWKAVVMKDDNTLWKVIDKNGINIADRFTSKDEAEKHIAYYVWAKKAPKPEPKPDTSTPKGEGAFGVIAIYGNGDIHTEHRQNFRNDGKRYDHKAIKTKGSEITGAFRLTGPLKEDEVSGKWSTVPHSGDNQTDCYDLGVKTTGGRSRLRFEKIHPNYTGNLAEGQKPAAPLGSKWVVYKFIKRVLDNGDVNLQIHQDASGENEGDKPANKFTKIFDYTDTKFRIKDVQPFATIRVDDPEKKHLKQVEDKWIHVQEIK